MNRYILATTTYGFIRKACHVSNGNVSKYDNDIKEYRQVPLLYVDKVAITLMSSVSSIYIWPMFLWNDLTKLELLLDKSKDPKLYNVLHAKKNYYDHIFT